jgi:hypothetical protein
VRIPALRTVKRPGRTETRIAPKPRRPRINNALDQSPPQVGLVRLVKHSRPLIAALMLLAWLSAGAHVALEFGGMNFGAHIGEATHEPGHHDHHDGDGGHHHHDLGTAARTQFAKTSDERLPAPHWTPVFDRLLIEWDAMLRSAAAERPSLARTDAPPDERMTGWLFTVRTALQVRGPAPLA